VQVTAAELRIVEDGKLIATHPVLEGRGQRRIAEGHRSLPPPRNSTTPRQGDTPPSTPPASTVTPRSLAIYDAIGRRLAAGEQPR
jgi:hypothetical protein